MWTKPGHNATQPSLLHHDAHSFVIGTEDLEEDIDFNTWWYDPDAQTLEFSEDDDEDE